MKAGLVYLRPARLVYSRATGPYETAMSDAWSKLQDWVERAGVSTPNARCYGLMRDNPMLVSADKCRYDACIEVDTFFEDRAIRDLGMITLPGGSYVRQREKASNADLKSRLVAMHTEFTVPNGLFIDNSRPVVTIYLDDPLRFKSGELRADVCMPVTAQQQRSKVEKAA